MIETAAAGRTASSIRDQARGILLGIPDRVSSLDHPALFCSLTGVTQAYLQSEWKRGSGVTTCNAFTGAYARRLGSHIPLGTFWPETTLARAGKAHAWVPAGSGGRYSARFPYSTGYREASAAPRTAPAPSPPAPDKRRNTGSAAGFARRSSPRP